MQLVKEDLNEKRKRILKYQIEASLALDHFLKFGIVHTVFYATFTPLLRVQTVHQCRDVLPAGYFAKNPGNMYGTLRSIVEKEGIRSLWRGTLINVVFFIPNFGALYFQNTNQALLAKYNVNEYFATFICHFLASNLTYPVLVTQWRRMADVRKYTYSSYSDLFFTIFEKSGGKGYFKGLTSFALLNFIRSSVLVFAISRTDDKNTQTASVICASLLFYPFDTIAKQLAWISKRENLVGQAKNILKTSGLGGFYRGVSCAAIITGLPFILAQLAKENKEK